VTLKEFFTMVHTYQGKSLNIIEQDWAFINNATGPGTADWQYYFTCWVVDGQHPWDYEVQNRVSQRYMKGWTTKDPFAIDHQPCYYPKPSKPRKERRILNS